MNENNSNKVENIELKNFRAFRGDINFDFKTDNSKIADLVMIYAPNGIGKTSFFDSIEWGLKGNIYRFDKNKIKDTNIYEDYRTNILRNRDSDKKNEEASVKIKCTNGMFIKRRTNNRSGYSDYTKGDLTDDSSLDKYTEWNSMILPYSKIDGFISSITPKDRFDDWSKFCDPESKGKNIFVFVSKLKKEIDKKINELENEINETQKNIDNIKVDRNTFDEINKNINKLYIKEDINNVKNEYDIDGITNIRNFSSIYINKLKNKQDKVNSDLGNLNNLKFNYANYSNNKEILNKIDDEILIVNKKIKNCDILTAYIKKSEEIVDDIANLNKIITELFFLKEDYSNWLINYEKYIANEITKNSLYEEIKKSNKEEYNLNDKIKKMKDDLFNLNEEKIKIENKYKLFIEKTTEYDSNKNKIILLKESIDKLYENNSILKSNLNKKNKTIEFLKENIIENIDNYESTLNTIIKNSSTLKYKRNDELSNLLIVLIRDYEKITEKNKYKNLIKNNEDKYKCLISDAIDIIEKNELSVCPICKSKFNETEELIKEIKGNSSYNKELEIVSKEIIDIEHNIKENRNRANEININRSKLIKDKISKLEVEYCELELEYKKNFEEIAENEKEMAKNSIKIKEIDKLFYEIGIMEINQTNIKKWYLRNEENAINKISLQEKELKMCNEKQKETILIIKQQSDSRDKIIKENKAFIKDEKNTQKIELIKKYNLDLTCQSLDNYEITILADIETKKEASLVLDKKIAEFKKLVNYDKDVLLISLKDQKQKRENLQNQINCYSMKKKEYFGDEDIDMKAVSNIIQKKEVIKSNIDSDIIVLEGLLKLIDNCKLDDNLSIYVSKLEKIKKEQLNYKEGQVNINKTYDEIKEKYKRMIVQSFEDKLSTDIFEKIEAHPIMNKIEFDIDISDEGIPLLRVFVMDRNGEDKYLPEWYFSSAQLNALALSMFLSRAISKQDAPIKTIFIDDPIASFDDINIIAFVDVIRSILEKTNYQIILSTHDESIYKLMKMKISDKYYNSKFIDLVELISGNGTK